MAFDNWSAFFAMGGHGFYVWTSYAVMIVGLAGLVLLSRRSQRRWLQQQRQALRRQQARQSASREPSSRPASPQE